MASARLKGGREEEEEEEEEAVSAVVVLLLLVVAEVVAVVVAAVLNVTEIGKCFATITILRFCFSTPAMIGV